MNLVNDNHRLRNSQTNKSKKMRHGRFLLLFYFMPSIDQQKQDNEIHAIQDNRYRTIRLPINNDPK